MITLSTPKCHPKIAHLITDIPMKSRFIRQKNSWGRFSISSLLFKRILAHLDVFPPFLDFVHAFGFKVREDDENFGGYHRRIYRSTNADGGPHSFGKLSRLSPPPPSCCQTADYLQRKNLRIISVTLRNMDGIWKALGRSDIWLFTTNLTQRRNRPSGFFSTLLRQYAKSSKRWFLSLLAVDLLIEDFYISCSCGWRRKIGENMSTT